MPLDFALIAHQESWRAASDVMAVLRGPTLPPIPRDELKEIFPWIPPRPVCHNELRSIHGHSVHGIYIDSFIPPDRLGPAFRAENIDRVRAAAACAIRLGAPIVSLGGFSSILLEGDTSLLPNTSPTVFTTGNTLTVAYIVQGIRKLCALQGRDLAQSTLLIVGATGDVGSGCARCLAPHVDRILLNARNPDRLRDLAEELAPQTRIEVATDLQLLHTLADIVICVASLESPSLLLGRLAPAAILCDAGYPKNLAPPQASEDGMDDSLLFYGGLGQSTAGITFTPDVHRVLQHHPFPNVAQGCMIEGMALALEGRFEPFSQGRGFIAPHHGLHLAPFFNAAGPLETIPGSTTLATRAI